jgi:tellurite resistance protein TerC
MPDENLAMASLAASVLGTPVWMWALFALIVFTLLALDLGVLNRRAKVIGVRQSLGLSAFYIAIAFIFGGWIWTHLGATSAKEYMTGYIVEKTLALDNIFVISLVFAYFAIPEKYQHRVLFWGILGVIVLRGVMIGAGTALVTQFSWTLYIFALFLIATGIKMLVMTEHAPDIGNNFVLKLLRRHLRVTPSLHGERFLVKRPDPKTGASVTWVTPLFVALILIEIVDVIFAVDSLPAIFAITTDPFIVYTSNIFAILGLRALYFALAAMVGRFTYLKQALALVLVFIGAKVFVADLAGLEKIPPGLSLTVTVLLIGGGIVYSLWRTRREAVGQPG